MQKYLDLASTLVSRLSAAETIEEMWALKAKFDSEFTAVYRAEQEEIAAAAARAAAEAQLAEAQAKLAALNGG